MTDREIVSFGYVACYEKGQPLKDWQELHLRAMPIHPVGIAIIGWVKYAQQHYERLCVGSHIGDDYVLGDYWAQMGVALRGLLNGETGGLDCGTCDHIIVQNLLNQGFDEEGGRIDEHT